MKNQEIEKRISEIRAELNNYLAIGSRESIMKSIAILEQTWGGIINKDDGIRLTSWFQKLWVHEIARGENHIFTNIHSIDDVINKYNFVRHAFFRLENDFPTESCLEALHTLSNYGLSPTAFQEFLEQEIEDGDKVITRISEITSGYPAT